jgi:hypothetical protein
MTIAREQITVKRNELIEPEMHPQERVGNDSAFLNRRTELAQH